MDKVISNAVLDIESLTSPPDVCCSGSPKTTVSRVFDIALRNFLHFQHKKLIIKFLLFVVSNKAFELNLLYPQKALSRKGSIRLERRIGEEQEADDSSKKIVVKGMRYHSFGFLLSVFESLFAVISPLIAQIIA